MTDKALRETCAKFYDNEVYRCYAIEALEAFAKQQRAEAWKEAANGVLTFPASRLPLENLILTQISEWCEQRAKELA